MATNSRTAGGMPDGSSGAGSLMCFSATSSTLSPRNGGSPVSSS
ncbi:hypothetical protein J2S46_001008 [Kitasatospora herbaricolor]|nr:hypothetical protein [Kitasatospora herbaricolor]MDQ0306452.1 hypothetical protein [Kitasatospora herbaricolor]